MLPFIYFTKAVDSFANWLPQGRIVTNINAKLNGVTINGTGIGVYLTHQWLHGPKEFLFKGNWVKNIAKMRTTGTVNDLNIIATTYLHWNLTTTTVWETKEQDKYNTNGLILQKVSGIIKKIDDDILISWNMDKPCWHNAQTAICARELNGNSVFSDRQWEHSLKSPSIIITNNTTPNIQIDGLQLLSHMKVEDFIQGNFDIYFDKLLIGQEKYKQGILALSIEKLKTYVVNDVIFGRDYRINNDAIINIHEASLSSDLDKYNVVAKIQNQHITIKGRVPKNAIVNILEQDIKTAMTLDLKSYDLSLDGDNMPLPQLRTISSSSRELNHRVNTTIASMVNQNYIGRHQDQYFINIEFYNGNLKLNKTY